MSSPGEWCFIALGSNLGDSAAIVRQAMEQLAQFSAEPLLKSSLWRSEPVDCPPGSAPFINAVAGLVPRSDETPKSLLGKLQMLERQFGRQTKKLLNEPRPLDLDLIAFGTRIVDTDQLVLPHPRAHLRRFVLAPLAEIVPDLVLPDQERSVSEILASLGPESRVVRVS